MCHFNIIFSYQIRKVIKFTNIAGYKGKNLWNKDGLIKNIYIYIIDRDMKKNERYVVERKNSWLKVSDIRSWMIFSHLWM